MGLPEPARGAAAVRAMRNAIAWLIVKGRMALDGDVDLQALRQAGAVLLESRA